MRTSLLLTAVLVAAANAGPASPRTEPRCAAYCLSGASSKFAYQPGHTYVYRYTSDVETTLVGTSAEASRLHVTATAEVTANSACDFTLQLRDVTLSDSDPADGNLRRTVEGMDVFKQELERYSLSFSYQDGRVEELCSSPQETVWALNFKRGLLSAAVNNLESLERPEKHKYEMDVSGYCATDYAINHSDGVTEVTKTKDLLTCRERGQLNSVLQTTPYHSSSKVQSMPLLRSTLTCRQTVQERRLRGVKCEEHHLFRPFSRGQSGAVTRTSIQLSELEVRRSAATPGSEALTARGVIIFDHTDGHLQQHSRLDSVPLLLTQLERATSDDVQAEAPRLFAQLVSVLRGAEALDLRQMVLSNQGRRRRLLLDTLPNLATQGALATMRDLMLIGSDDLKPNEADKWMTSLAFIQEPNLDMVVALKPLITADPVSPSTLLGISTMVHNLLKLNPEYSSQPPVRQIITGIETILGSNCFSRNEQEKTLVLSALKALGNAGLLIQSENALRSCYETTSNSMEIRLAAIKAYRRMSCQEISNSKLMSTLANQKEDTEIRIAAYLAIMQCPNHAVVDKLIEILTRESINQVGSFIWTHLTNLQESNDPSKQVIKTLLNNVDIEKKFNTDARKFSRYFEKTLFFESMNVGASAEGMVVFSPESYVPRSGMLNITVDVFGEAINFLEIGGRIEGLEDYIEEFIGTNGVYPQEALTGVLKSLRKRSENNEINKLVGKYNAGRADANGFRASTFMKVFGNELSFNNYNNIDNLIRSFGYGGPQNLLQLFQRELDWTDNYQFLDSSYTLPTIAGLPFTLKASGTAAVSLKTGGALNVPSWNRVDVAGFLKPSAAVEIIGEMGVSAQVAQTGMKITTDLHTSSILEGELLIDSGKVVSLKIKMPRDKVELLDVHTSFHTVNRNHMRELDTLSSDMFHFNACTEDYTAPVLGVNFCTELRYPFGSETTPLFPLSGPLTAHISIQKTDTMKEYVFEYVHSSTEGVRTLSVILDTPGSSINRRVHLDYMLNYPEKAVRLGVVTPLKSLEVSGSLDLEGNEQQLTAQLKLDGSEVFGVYGSLDRKHSAHATHYQPTLVIRGYRGPLLNIAGILEADHNKHKYNIALNVTELFETPLALQGSLEEKAGSYVLYSTMRSHALDSTISGDFRYSGDSLLLQTLTEYSLMKGPRHTIAINTQLSREHLAHLTTYRAAVDTKVSALPVLDVQLEVEHRVGPERQQTSVQLSHAGRRYLLGSELFSSERSHAAQATLQAQHLDIDFKVAFNLDLSTAEKTSLGMLARLNRDRFATGALVIHHLAENTRYSYGISTNVTLMTSSYLLDTGVQGDLTTNNFRFVASRSTPGESRVISIFGSVAEEEDGSLTLDASLRLPGYPSTRLAGRLVTGTRGVFGVSAALHRSAHTYNASLEYRYQEQHLVEGLAAGPDFRYSILMAAKTEGGNYKFRTDINAGRRIRAVFSLRPHRERFDANFELYWNKGVDDSRRVVVEVSREGYGLTAHLQYPGRTVHLTAALTQTGVLVSLDYAPDKKIVVEGTVLVHPHQPTALQLSVHTPFPGYRVMQLVFRNKPPQRGKKTHLNFEVVGKVEEQTVTLTCRLGWLLRGITSSGGNSGDLSLHLQTPFSGWQNLNFTAIYRQDTRGLNLRLQGSKNEDTCAIGLFVEKTRLQENFKVTAGLDFALPLDLLQRGEIRFNMDLGKSSFEANTLVQWKNQNLNVMSMNSQTDYNFTSGVMVNSAIQIKTPFSGLRNVQIKMLTRKDKQDFQAQLTVQQDGIIRPLFHTHLKGTYSSSAAFNGDFQLQCSKCPRFGTSIDYRNQETSTKLNMTAQWKEKNVILTFETSAPSPERGDICLTLILPQPIRQYQFKQSSHIDYTTRQLWNHVEISRDQQKVTWDVEFKYFTHENGTFSFRGIGKMTSPFLGWETANVTQESIIHPTSSGIDFKNTFSITRMDQKIDIIDTGVYKSFREWHLDRIMTSNTEWFRKVTLNLLADWHQWSGQLSGKAVWDGQISQLTLVNTPPADNSNTLFDAALSAQWFGQSARRATAVISSSTNSWKPVVTFSYAPDKAIKLHGSLHKPAMIAQSYMKLEIPSSDAIELRVSHDMISKTKHFGLEIDHGQTRKYMTSMNLRADLPYHLNFTANLETPIPSIGSNAITLAFRFSDTLVVDTRVAHNEQELSLFGTMDQQNGRLVITTPIAGLQDMTFKYGVFPKRAVMQLITTRGNIEAEFKDVSSQDTFEYTARVSTPFPNFRSFAVLLTKPVLQNTFSVKGTHNGHNTVMLTGHFELSAPSSSIDLQLTTPFQAMRAAQLQLSYNLIDHTARFLFSKGRYIIQAYATADVSLASSTFAIEYRNNLLPGPRLVTISGTFSVTEPEKRVDLRMKKDGSRFTVEARAQVADVTSYFTLNVVSSVSGFENIGVLSRITNAARGPVLAFELRKNGEIAKANLKFEATETSGRVQFDIQTPFKTNRDILLSAEYDVLSSPIRAEVVAERDGIRKVVLATAEWSTVGAHLTLSTPFRGFELLEMQTSLHDIATERELRLILKCNQDQIDAVLRADVSWPKSKFVMEITTPVQYLQRLEIQAKYDLSSQTKQISVSLTRNDRKLEGTLTGTLETTFAEGTATIITPYAGWRNVKYIASYDFTQVEKYIRLTSENNGIKKTLSTRGSYNDQAVQLQVTTPFEGYEQIGARTFHINNRQKREIGYEAHVNSERHRMYILYEREGQNNVKIRLNTPIQGMHDVGIDARMQSFQDGVGIYVHTNIEGKRSSMQIRTSLGKKTMGIDVDIESHREGFENIKLSGSVNYSKKKKAFSLKSDSRRQKMEFSGFYVIKAKGGIGKLVSKLPFPGLEKVNAKLRYKLGKKNVFKLQYSTKGKKKQISGDLKYTPTSFVVNLKTPFNGFEKISAKAGRNAKKNGAVSAELSLKRGPRLVSVKYNYLFTFKTGDGTIEITSPYEGFEDMKMSLTYQNQPSYRNVKFMARRNSREWLIDSSRKWGDGTEEDNLVLTSPIETIRSLKISRSFNVRNLADMQYYASYERNDRKFTISGTGSIQAIGKKVALDLVVQTPLDIGQLSANIKYDFTQMPLTLSSSLSAGARNVKLAASLDNSAGTMTITTTEPGLSRVDIAYTAIINRLTRKVTGSIALADGRRLSIDFEDERRSAHEMTGAIQITSTSYGQGKITWSYAQPNDDLTAKFSVSSRVLNADLSVSIQGQIFVDRKIIVAGSVSTSEIRRSTVLEITYHRRNGFYSNVDWTIDNDKYLLTVDLKNQGRRKIIEITYDGKRIHGVKLDGSFQNTGTAQEYSLSYRQGNTYATYTGSSSMGPSGRSGSSVSEFASSFMGASSTELSWDFIAPNRLLQYKTTLNGKVYAFKLSGTGQSKVGSYSVALSIPRFRISRNKYISEISAALEYDVSRDIFVQATLSTPFQSEVRFSYNQQGEKTGLHLLLHLRDQANILHNINHKHFEISVNRTISRSGANVQAMLDTSAFQLGKAEISADIQKTSDKSIITATYTRGGRVGQIQGEAARTPSGGSSTFSLSAPIAGFEDVQLSASYEHQPGQKYSANFDYSRGHRYLRAEGTVDISKKLGRRKILKSLGITASFKLSSKITRPVELLVEADTNITDFGSPKQSGSGKFNGQLNGKKIGLTYTVDRDDHGRRKGSLVLNLPLRKPYQKIVLTSDASLHSNTISGSIQYGSKNINGEISWLAGEAGQYGAELKITTPFNELKTFDLDVRGTLNRDNSLDVALHVRYNKLLAHITGVVRRYALDLRFETPTLGDFKVKGGVDISATERKYSVHGLVTLPSGATAGGEVTVKATSLQDFQLTVDIQTPLPEWQRFSVDVAFTNIAKSRIIRAALQLPKQKRVEVSMELTNKGSDGLTDLRAGVTTNYLGNVFTFWTNIYRDSAGMKYELEIESPVHINLPLLGHRH